MTHTPGPWLLDDDTLDVFSLSLGDAPAYIASLLVDDNGGWRLRKRDVDANARLITAAPELLAACKQWLAFYDKAVRQECFGDEPGIEAMRSAVLKAEGV
jgi:hypothetical protein